MLKKKLFIIGLSLFFSATALAPATHAIYSPTVAEQVRIIKENLAYMRQQYGVGTLTDAFTVWSAKDRECREAQKEAETNKTLPTACGVSSEMANVINSIKKTIIADLVLQGSFFDSFTMLFNYVLSENEYISTCLRDDIFELEALQDAVVQQAVRAPLLGDIDSMRVLFDNFLYLKQITRELKKNYRDTPRWFGSAAARNFYLNNICPYGEFREAGEDFVRSFENFTDAITNISPFGWGSISEAAQARARIRAMEWIRENQITLTIAGEEGGNPTSLLQSEEGGNLQGNFAATLKFLWDAVGLPIPVFSWNNPNPDADFLEGRELTEAERQQVETHFKLKWEDILLKLREIGESAESVTRIVGYSQGPDGDQAALFPILFYNAPAPVLRSLFGPCAYFDQQTEAFRPCTDEERARFEAGQYDPSTGCPNCRSTDPRNPQTVAEEALAAIDANRLARKNAEEILTYHSQLVNTSEASLALLETPLFEINGTIRQAYEEEASASLPTFCKNIKRLNNNQCINKDAEAPSC